MSTIGEAKLPNTFPLKAQNRPKKPITVDNPNEKDRSFNKSSFVELLVFPQMYANIKGNIAIAQGETDDTTPPMNAPIINKSISTIIPPASNTYQIHHKT